MSGLKIADQRTALVTGVACLVAGTWCIYQAFDARGAKRPYWLSFFPGL